MPTEKTKSRCAWETVNLPTMRCLHAMCSGYGNGIANLPTGGLEEPDMNTEHPEMLEEESNVILYTTNDGKAQVSLMSRDGRVWLNQKQMAKLFAVTKMNISLHIANILKEKELDDSVVKFFFMTAANGK